MDDVALNPWFGTLQVNNLKIGSLVLGFFQPGPNKTKQHAMEKTSAPSWGCFFNFFHSTKGGFGFVGRGFGVW